VPPACEIARLKLAHCIRIDSAMIRNEKGKETAKMPGKPNFAELNEGFERADALGGIK